MAREDTPLDQETFDRVLADIRKYSQRDTFADDVCVVGMQIRHTE